MVAKIRTAPRKNPRQRRSVEMVAKILDAASKVLVREGYERATTNRIAKVAGISVGSLYQYFANKESLVAALAQRHSEAMWAVYTKNAAVLAAEPLAVAAAEHIRKDIAAHAVDPKLHKVFVEQVPRVGTLEKVDEVGRKVVGLIRARLELHKNEIIPKDLDMASFVVFHVSQALVRAAIVERPEYLAGDRLADEITAVVTRYLLGASAIAPSQAGVSATATATPSGAAGDGSLGRIELRGAADAS